MFIPPNLVLVSGCFNVSLNTYRRKYVYMSNGPTNSVKALTEGET